MNCIADLHLDPSSSCDHRAAPSSATFHLDRADSSFSRLTLHCRGNRRPTAPSHDSMHLRNDRSKSDHIPKTMLQSSLDGWNAESHAPSMARQPIHAHRSIHSFAMCGMGFELDKITRLLRSWLHSGVGANKGGADQSAFTHTATPCEKALLPLPRHSAVIPLSRLRRRTSVIFGSVSYAIQPQKPSEGDQKKGRKLGLWRQVQRSGYSWALTRATLVAASQHEARQHRHALPAIGRTGVHPSLLHCIKYMPWPAYDGTGRDKACAANRGGRGETARARVTWKHGLRLIFVFVREHHTVSDAPGSSETDRPTLEWHPGSAAPMLHRRRATVHTWQRQSSSRKKRLGPRVRTAPSWSPA